MTSKACRFRVTDFPSAREPGHVDTARDHAVCAGKGIEAGVSVGVHETHDLVSRCGNAGANSCALSALQALDDAHRHVR